MNKFQCKICFDDLFNGETLNTTLCGHVFHCRCIRYALHIDENSRCPLCRSPSNRRDLIVLHFGENTLESEVTDASSTISVANTTATVVATNFRLSQGNPDNSDGSDGSMIPLDLNVADDINNSDDIPVIQSPQAAENDNLTNITDGDDSNQVDNSSIVADNSKSDVAPIDQPPQAFCGSNVRPMKIIKRRPTKEIDRFSFKKKVCVFCCNKFIDSLNLVACQTCIRLHQK